jgi:hypothetical protein
MRRGAVLLLLAALTVAGPVAVADAHTLSRSKAKRAAQRKADRFADQKTRVNVLMRMSRHRYYAQAKWTRTIPEGCKGCGYNESTGQVYDTPTYESCWIEMGIRFRSRRSRHVITRITSEACF